MKDVSVVICTRDRPALLRRALGSLAAQTVGRDRIEIVVVDNGAGEQLVADGSADVVVREAEPGLSRARNRGWAAASAPLVAFLDDDAEAAPDWIERVLELGRRHPEAAVVGGPIFPLYEQTPPPWFRDAYELRTWGECERLLEPGEALSGSNMAVRASTLAGVGGFDERFGMIGDRLRLGEDTAFFERLARDTDARAVYSPDLVVRHLVPEAKMTVRYQLGRAAAAGEAWASGRGLRGSARAGRVAADAAMALALSLRALVRVRRPFRQWAVEELAPVAGRIGSLRGALA